MESARLFLASAKLAKNRITCHLYLIFLFFLLVFGIFLHWNSTYPPLALSFFRKPTSPPLPLREGPPLISVFFPQGRRGNRPTRCSNRFAIRLADHQRSSPAAELHFAVCDRMDTNRLQAACSMLAAQYWLLARCWMLAECSLDACLLVLVIAAKGYLESFSVNMFLRKRVLPRM